MNYELRKAYTEYFASLDWDYFTTLTFREWKEKDGTVRGVYTPDGARRAAQRYLHGWPTLELALLFIESGDLYGKIHLHGLLRFSEKYTPPALDVGSGWYDRYGYATVEAPRSQVAVSNYCAKYCTKHMKDETYLIHP